MVRIYQNGNNWIYEYNGEIVAVEYSRQMAIACGEARVKALQANKACSRQEPAGASESQVSRGSCG